MLILALNSARPGYETMIYFTFGGLNMIRPGKLRDLRYYPTEGVEIMLASDFMKQAAGSDLLMVS